MNEESISNSLLEFLQSQIPTIKVDDLDDILLDYVGSILKDLKEDSSHFDLDEFYEMLIAYIPDSSVIQSETVGEWLIRTAEEQRGQNSGASSSLNKAGGGGLDLVHMMKEKTLIETAPENGKEEDGSLDGEEEEEEEDAAEDQREEFQDMIDNLSELFPYACQLEVVHCLSLASGDIDKAAQLIMHRNETGQSFRARTDRKIIKPNSKPKLNEKELKEKIVGKYGFIDQAEDSRYHRPTIKKADDKKLIRYRDGKIVSTKGERFTQVKKENPEDVKKSHVNISSDF